MLGFKLPRGLSSIIKLLLTGVDPKSTLCAVTVSRMMTDASFPLIIKGPDSKHSC